jgi:TolB-like protein
MPDVFLSYSRDDQATARHYAEALGRAGFSVWWDQTLRSGEAYDQVTEKSLREAKAVVVLWSKCSVNSRWVRAEATIADRAGTLMPVAIEPCERPVMFELTQTAELPGWRGRDNDPTWQAFVSDVRALVARGAGEAKLPPTASPANSGRGRMARPMIAALVGAGLVLLTGAVWLWQRSGTAEGSVTASSATATSAPVSLAVLPFSDLSPARDQEYFSDGLAEEILNQLAQIKDLHVAGRTSSFSFKGRSEDLREIAAKLNVGNLLEGSVRKEGEQLRITAQLIEGSSGVQRWSKIYNGELSGVFALQEQIARDVATQLSVELDVGEISLAKGGTRNFDALDRYLQSRRLTLLDGGREASEQAVLLAREAVALDPQFARGWLQLWVALAGSTAGLPDDRAMRVHEEMATATARVQELTPEAWWTRILQARELITQRRWAEAEELTRVLMEEGPLTAADLERGGVRVGVLLNTGRMSEAIRLAQSAILIEPQSLSVSTDLQMMFDTMGRSDLAEQEYRRSLDLSGAAQRSFFLRFVRLLGDAQATPQMIEAQLASVLDSPNVDVPLLRELRGQAANGAAARKLIRAALDDPRYQDYIRLQILASLADAYGDAELTLAAVRKAMPRLASFDILWIVSRSGVRSLPGFKALVTELGLPDFWRQTGKWSDFCQPVDEADFECH